MGHVLSLFSLYQNQVTVEMKSLEILKYKSDQTTKFHQIHEEKQYHEKKYQIQEIEELILGN